MERWVFYYSNTPCWEVTPPRWPLQRMFWNIPEQHPTWVRYKSARLGRDAEATNRNEVSGKECAILEAWSIYQLQQMLGSLRAIAGEMKALWADIYRAALVDVQFWCQDNPPSWSGAITHCPLYYLAVVTENGWSTWETLFPYSPTSYHRAPSPSVYFAGGGALYLPSLSFSLFPWGSVF